jgi:hypothetical protein
LLRKVVQPGINGIWFFARHVTLHLRIQASYTPKAAAALWLGFG